MPSISLGRSFALGTFAQSDQTPFPAIVLDEQVIPLELLAGATSILALLENWDANFAALQAAVSAWDGNSVLALSQVKRAKLIAALAFRWANTPCQSTGAVKL